MALCQTSIGSPSVSRFRPFSAILAAILGCVACPLSFSATRCAGNPGSGCVATIGQALALSSPGDTIQVQAGVYNESLVITQPVSIVGVGASQAILNAINQPNGIFINGMAMAPAAGVHGVVISGITVQNANFEGILAVNATSITIANNQVIGNNRSLNTANTTCPGLPAFETSEAEDCGEGIHLMAVDHSVVSNNIVKNNSGGILISDETGPNHDNIITGNTVSSNLFDCGITLASHSPAAVSGLKLPAGVYHNTISGNTVSNNGTQLPGAGAGVGIFAAGPGNQNYGNVIINNTLTGNGLPGVTMHNHASVTGAPPVNLNDNVIVGNQISGNGADTDDAATPGTAGINIFSVAPVTGTVIAQNNIRNQQISVAFNVASGSLQVHLNDLQGTTGVNNLGAGTVDASQNYWGCAAGPVSNYGCSGTSGTVTIGAWATSPY
jgi:parallel beta-helix repeat protein